MGRIKLSAEDQVNTHSVRFADRVWEKVQRYAREDRRRTSEWIPVQIEQILERKPDTPADLEQARKA